MHGNIKAVEYRVNLKNFKPTTCYNKKSRRLVLRLGELQYWTVKAYILYFEGTKRNRLIKSRYTNKGQ